MPALPIPGQQGGVPGFVMPQVELNCAVPYGLVGSCAAQPHTIANPADRFKWNCAAYGGCYGATITIDIPAPMPGMPTHDGIEFLAFTEPFAGYYATANINNPSACTGGNNIKLHNVECKADSGCMGLTINTQGVDIGDVHCDPESACLGCKFVQQSCNPMLPPVETSCIDMAR